MRVHLGISHTKFRAPVGLPAWSSSKSGRSCQSDLCSPCTSLLKKRVSAVSISPRTSVNKLSPLMLFRKVDAPTTGTASPTEPLSILARFADGTSSSVVFPVPICARAIAACTRTGLSATRTGSVRGACPCPARASGKGCVRPGAWAVCVSLRTRWPLNRHTSNFCASQQRFQDCAQARS